MSGQSDSRVQLLVIPYGPLNPLKMISDCRAKSNPWALLGVAQKQNKQTKKHLSFLGAMLSRKELFSPFQGFQKMRRGRVWKEAKK